ncbi:hypothetical protein NL676_032600 [Syzygium grande]|nr:hypothetical protein NL676_032600 [Syzygium grande]
MALPTFAFRSPFELVHPRPIRHRCGHIDCREIVQTHFISGSKSEGNNIVHGVSIASEGLIDLAALTKQNSMAIIGQRDVEARCHVKNDAVKGPAGYVIGLRQEDWSGGLGGSDAD